MLKPFFVPLPQYDNPQDDSFAQSNLTLDVANAVSAGSTEVILDVTGSFQGANYNSNDDGSLRPGDMITFSDPQDSNHLKAYKITRVRTPQSDNPTAANRMVIGVSPSLQKDVAVNAFLVYKNPKIKVVLKSDVVSYELKNDNLYSYSLQMEEVQ